ncbi:hypothetical protein MUU72_06030, partial [Streptomyces sp. RS10V-4]|nr:hypothetical protein [Streptomyces rhizoryzae]
MSAFSRYAAAALLPALAALAALATGCGTGPGDPPPTAPRTAPPHPARRAVPQRRGQPRPPLPFAAGPGRAQQV